MFKSFLRFIIISSYFAFFEGHCNPDHPLEGEKGTKRSQISAETISKEKDEASAPKKQKQATGKEKEEEETAEASAPFKTSADIGEWMGTLKGGIGEVSFKYGELPLTDITEWHKEAGKQMNKLHKHLEQIHNTTNMLMARIDLIYSSNGKIIKEFCEIPAFFISGHFGSKAKRKVIDFEKSISHALEQQYKYSCISSDSYFKWENLNDKDYKSFRKELGFLIDASAISEIDNNFLDEKYEGIMHNHQGGFTTQWIHSEEAFILFILGKKQAIKTDDNPIISFKEIIEKIKLPKDALIEACILSIVSRNDCCTNCKPLMFRTLEMGEALTKSLKETLTEQQHLSQTFRKSLIYIGDQEFKKSRKDFAEGGKEFELAIYKKEHPVLFLMATNGEAEEIRKSDEGESK